MPLVYLSLIGFLTALAVALGVTPVVRRLALAKGWVDRPDGERKLHTRPTPALGGIGVFAGSVAGLVAAGVAAPLLGVPGFGLPVVIVVGGVVMFATGLWDDLRGLGFKSKLAIELVVAYALLVSDRALLIDLTAVPFVGADPYTHALFAIPVTLLWIVGVMNAINLIDGIDGLAAGVAVIALASLAAAFGGMNDATLLVVAFVITGGLLGFLRYNLNPASIFMGDSGSLFVGFVLAVYTLSGTGHPNSLVALAIPLVALGLPIFDTVLSMLRRVIGRQAIMAPDRDHIHHRMTARTPVRRAVFILYAIAAGFGLIAVGMSLTTAVAAPWWIALAIVGAATFATTLGYVRRPYMPPVLIDAVAEARPEGKSEAIDNATIADEPVSDEPGGASGDGTMVAAGLETPRESEPPPDLTLSPTP